MSSADRALVFPGQGAQAPEMLAGFAGLPSFGERLRQVSAALGQDTLPRLEAGDRDLLDRNAVSSLLTVCASRLALDRYGSAGEPAPAAFAGYSVGQWTALHAAGVLDFATLVRVVRRRAALMDDCAERLPGGMIAVIGLRDGDVEDICSGLRGRGLAVWIANYNCVGQLSIAGEPAALDAALDALADRQPKKLLRLPVAGAWHSELMRDAAGPFRDFLEGVDLQPPRAPVVDNVSGGLLPGDPSGLRDRLAEHLYRPIRWQAGVRRLVGAGCRELIEVGWGNMLTKFGFFIDRSVRHRAFGGADSTRQDTARSVR